MIESVLVFCNKVMMKDKLKYIDIKLLFYCKVILSLDLLKFVEFYFYFIVVKKIDGIGFKEVVVIYLELELEYRLEEGFKGEWIVEEFVLG